MMILTEPFRYQSVGLLKHVMYWGPFDNLGGLKKKTDNLDTQHIHNIILETLHSVVEHPDLSCYVCQFKSINSEQTIEHFLIKLYFFLFMFSSLISFSTVLSLRTINNVISFVFFTVFDIGTFIKQCFFCTFFI